ncbi:hypothetical protein D3OALGA1CA_1612 [Olavius algarvensis associated proteobacterium Delta 3]|nr:hypothetical protein D3OALGB2SA_411 [Olavius algarvensis associated proteobacterium Delta 3]CAB5103837.1 hypothetical protein D3OALGA1CA_1612 [Olavius algarvensis associated proteobacterium Delta 3]
MNLRRIGTVVVAMVLVGICSGTASGIEESHSYLKFPLGRYRCRLRFRYRTF